MQTRSLIASFALTATCFAQDQSSNSSDLCKNTLNVSGQADLDRVAGCRNFSGDIIIHSSGANLVFNGIEQVDGSITANNITDLVSISAPQLKTITNSLQLIILQSLNTLAMPQLTKVGSLELRTLPMLRETQFNSGIQEARNVLISDTQLQALTGLNLSQVDNLNINNNRYISDITVGVTSITNLLDISFNANKVNVSLPYLKWANNATFQFCSSVDLPLLQKVNLSMGFINNTLYGINCPNLTEIGQSLAITSNSKLSNISMAVLNRIGGGFQIANNTNLKAITGFPKLKSVGGAIDFVGNFSKASLPSIQDVEGGVMIDSSAEIDCESFDRAHADGDFHGDRYVCKGLSTTASFSMTASPRTSSSSEAMNAQAMGESSSTASGSAVSRSSTSRNGAEQLRSPGLIGALGLALLSLI